MPVLRLQLLPQIWVQNFIGNNEFAEYCPDVMQPSDAELQKDKLCVRLMHWVDTRIVSTELQSSSRC
jgi:hypothetical protein